MEERLCFMDGDRRENTVRLLRPGEGDGKEKESIKRFGRKEKSWTGEEG